MSDENFIGRWSRLKRDANTSEAPDPAAATPVEPPAPEEPAVDPVLEAEPAPELTDADMPPLETLGFNSDYSGFFSAKVSAELRTAALRKLFHQPEFNVIDQLDDYCGDYTTYAPLGKLLTADMKHQMERSAREHLKSLMDKHAMTHDTLHTARQQALASLSQHPQAITGSVGYLSHGKLLIIGGAEALNIAAGLPDTLKPHILLTEAKENVPASIITPLAGWSVSISGHLGAFVVEVGGTLILQADIVLDLQPTPSLQRGILPPGYFAPTSAKLDTTLAELPDLIGEFSKPRYFHYDASICAHSSSGLHGCTRCIDACPAEAIISIGTKIEVNPNLCQGGGACASACPSGAIRYQYPSPAHSIDQLRVMLRTFLEAGGIAPKILFHRREMDVPLEALPATILPFPVEELGSTSPELWFAALSFGASQILLYDETATPELSRQTLQQQLATAHAQLLGLGYAAEAIQMLAIGTPVEGISPAPIMPTFPPATQGGMNDKRQQWRVALDHLYRHAPQPAAEIPLPAGAPFGLLQIDKDACTLCLACATICPLKALEGGIGKPQLRFHTNRCVQCGLCATGCPEKAITLQPLYITDPEQRRLPQVLNEEEPFCCIRCGKPFGSQSAIHLMLTKLANHPMFQDERARKRLEMCEDCRVMDVVQDNDAMGDTMSRILRH